MIEYPPMEGTTAAPSWGHWHNRPECEVHIMNGPTQLFIYCVRCRIAVNLEAIAFRSNPKFSFIPREELPDDKSDAGPGG